MEYFDALLERVLASMIGWVRAIKAEVANPEDIVIGVETCKRTSDKRGGTLSQGRPPIDAGGVGVIRSADIREGEGATYDAKSFSWLDWR